MSADRTHCGLVAQFKAKERREEAKATAKEKEEEK